jgi:catechol 2,3-dioxygenase-like lactoylglutathione lyase family enzyme
MPLTSADDESHHRRSRPPVQRDLAIVGYLMDVGDRPSWAEETIPVLHVSDAAEALARYRRLGFEEEWTHRFEPGFPAFASIRRGTPGTGVRIFLSEHHGDAQPNGLLYLRVSDVAPVAAEFGVDVHDSGARYEVGLVDPDGNRIRVGSPTGRTEPGYTYAENGS